MDSLQADASRLHIGPRKQFFFDDLIVESVQNLARRVHSPQKVEQAPLIQRDRPWEQVTYFTFGSWQVMRDPADGIFKCWYEDWQMYPDRFPDDAFPFAHPEHAPSRYLFARSSDGIHWEKPELDIYREQGKETNIVLGDDFGSIHCGYVFYDPLEENDEYRFKILFISRPSSSTGLHYRYAASPDGIHWKPWAALSILRPLRKSSMTTSRRLRRRNGVKRLRI